MQELNKKLNTMVNGKNVEMERVAKLTNEIMNLEDLLVSIFLRYFMSFENICFQFLHESILKHIAESKNRDTKIRRQ